MPTLADVSRSRMLESVYDRFESAWRNGEEPSIDEFLIDHEYGPQRERVLHELVLIDLEYRWRRGSDELRANHEDTTLPKLLPTPFASCGRPFLEDYVERWPEFGPSERLPISAIVHEFRIRCDAGDTPELAEYFRRFPSHAIALREALQLEVEERLHSHKSTRATHPADSASTGHNEGTPTRNRSSKRKLAPGDQLGRYRILWPVGHGAMGVVYLAYDPELDRQIAIKVPFLDGPHSERLTQRFRREAKLTASLRHPHICRVLDVDRQNEFDFLTMDYIDGTSLETLLKSGPLMPPAEAARIVRKIATALQEAHAASVIHRDIKPSNILIDRRGEPVLTDFGLARRPEIDESEQTRPGEWLGTPAYMAPEQFSGNPDDVSPGCDIFSLGVVLFRLLTGQRPFSDGYRREDIANRTPPAAPHTVRPGLSLALSEICLHALRFDPHERFSSAGEFAAALEPFTRDSFADANAHDSTSTSLADSPATTRPINRVTALSLAAATCVLGFIAAWSMFKSDSRPVGATTANASTNGSVTKDTALRLLPRLELHIQRANQSQGYHVLGPEVGSLKSGDKMQFHVTLDAPAFIALFYVDAEGVVSRRSLPVGQVENLSHRIKDLWDPPLDSANELQDMHILGGAPGMELIVAVASAQPFDEANLGAIERIRLNPISATAGFSFVARHDTSARDNQKTNADHGTSEIALSNFVPIRVTTLPLGSDPRQFGLAGIDQTRTISGQTATRKSEWLDWDKFAERLTRLGEFSHGIAFRHTP